jgi:mRNA interferase HicA
VKRHELLAHLRRQGCQLEREGSRHSVYRNPANSAKTTVPRHVEINNQLAVKICKQLGVEPIR